MVFGRISHQYFSHALSEESLLGYGIAFLSFYGKFCVSLKQHVFGGGGTFQEDNLSVLRIIIYFFSNVSQF